MSIGGFKVWFERHGRMLFAGLGVVVFASTNAFPTTDAHIESLRRRIAESDTCEENLINSAVEENGFEKSRGLAQLLRFGRYEATEVLPELYSAQEYVGLEDSLRSLKAGDIWLSGGAGNAVAEQEFLEDSRFSAISSKVQIISIGYAEPTDPKLLHALNKHKNFSYLSGKTFERMVVDGDSDAYWGHVALISDLVGIANYSRHLDSVVDIYLHLLRAGGAAYLNPVDFGLTIFTQLNALSLTKSYASSEFRA